MGANFTHQVCTRRRAAHSLVTSGVYSLERHPSYLGFFLFALGAQLALGNPLSAALGTAAMNKFFKERVDFEEHFLEHFFGEEFLAYKRATFSFADYLL